MKISKLTNGLLVSLLLTASVAGADDEYPATDFQPKVVFQDSDYKHTESSLSSEAKSANAGEVSVADSNYPAANFEPEVLYKDEDYKHKAGDVSSTSSSTSTSSSATTSSTEIDTESSDESSLNLIIGLALLAVAGFVFYRNNASNKGPAKKKKAVKKVAKKSAESSVIASSDGVVSGVSKYLEGKVGTTPSGVAKYLEEKNTSVSRVSKYVAKQKISARVASVTGVEKYLKDKG